MVCVAAVIVSEIVMAPLARLFPDRPAVWLPPVAVTVSFICWVAVQGLREAWPSFDCFVDDIESRWRQRSYSGFRGGSNTTISRAPGWRLSRILSFVYSTKTFDRVFKQAIADMQQEHFDALAQGSTTKASWVVVRGYWSIGTAVVARLPVSLSRAIVELWRTTS